MPFEISWSCGDVQQLVVGVPVCLGKLWKKSSTSVLSKRNWLCSFWSWLQQHENHISWTKSVRVDGIFSYVSAEPSLALDHSPNKCPSSSIHLSPDREGALFPGNLWSSLLCRTCCRALARSSVYHSAPQAVLSQLNMNVSWPGPCGGHRPICLYYTIFPYIQSGLEVTSLWDEK